MISDGGTGSRVSKNAQDGKSFTPRRKYEKQFIVKDFPQEWLEESIQTADHESIQRKKIFAEFLESITSGKDKWFFITGTQNTGRSYVSAMMANEIAKRDLGQVCFINTSTRFRQLMDYSTKKNDLFYTVLNYYCACKLLVLDDFGNEYKKDAEFLFHCHCIRVSKDAKRDGKKNTSIRFRNKSISYSYLGHYKTFLILIIMNIVDYMRSKWHIDFYRLRRIIKKNVIVIK